MLLGSVECCNFGIGQDRFWLGLHGLLVLDLYWVTPMSSLHQSILIDRVLRAVASTFDNDSAL